MISFLKSKLLWIILLILIIAPTFVFFLNHDYFNMHDDMQMIRQLEMEKCLLDGQIPCRWTPDLGFGYGYPLFNFYPPLPYFVGEMVRVTGVSFVTSIKITALFQIVLSAVFMFILVSTIYGNLGGFISALFYSLSPYHAVNVYIRGAMNEAWASVFFPLIFYFVYKLIKTKEFRFIIGLSLSWTGLLLSHNPMALTFAPFFLVWCFYWLNDTHGFKNILNLIKNINIYSKLIFSGILAVFLSAFFTLPVLLESKFVQIESMFTNYYHFSVHFVSLPQLFFSSFWGDGPSVWGSDDGMSYSIGFLHWIAPLFIFLYFILNSLRNKKFDRKLFLPILIFFIGMFAVFMTHNKSTFIWSMLPLVQKIQFPWRFLSHASFLLSLSVGIFPYVVHKIFKNKVSTFASILLIISVVTLNTIYFHPLQSGPLSDEQKFSGLAWRNQVTSGIYDYLPKTAKKAAAYPAKDYVDKIIPEDTITSIWGQKKGTDWMFFNLSLNKESQVFISQLAFPNFMVYDNGQPINYSIEPELGRIVLNLNTGDHQIYVKLQNTPIRAISNYLSLFSWIFILIYMSKFLWIKSIYKK